MDAEDGTRIYRELALAHKIPCVLEFTGTRHIIRVPLFSERPNTKRYALLRAKDTRDLNYEEEGIVIGLGTRAKLIVEYQKDKGEMTIW